MNFGVRLSQLEQGDILATNVLNYQALNGTLYFGAQAASQKLQDGLSLLNGAGLTWLLDAVSPQFDQYGNLTLANLLNNTLYGNNWDFATRVNLYEQLTNIYDLQLVVQVNFPAPITPTTGPQYVAFMSSLVAYMPWVRYWQIGVNPELLTPNGTAFADPSQYVNVLRDIYNNIKITNPTTYVLGPGLSKGMFDLLPTATQQQYIITNNYTQNDYQVGWLNYAIEAGLLYYCDIFSFEAFNTLSTLTTTDLDSATAALQQLIFDKLGGSLPIFVLDEGSSSYNTTELQQAYDDVSVILESYADLLPTVNPNLQGNSLIPSTVVFKKELFDRAQLELQFNPTLALVDLSYGMLGLNIAGNTESLYNKEIFTQLTFLVNNLGQYDYGSTTPAYLVPNTANNPQAAAILLYSFTNQFDNQVASILLVPNYLSTNPLSYTVAPNTTISVVTLNGIASTFDGTTTIAVSQLPTLVITSVLNSALASFANLQTYVSQEMNNLLALLPPNYNTALTDLNFYKLYGAAAQELGTAYEALNMLLGNGYVGTAQGDALDRNFGALINLPRQPGWDDATYSYLIQTIVQALLTGPTLENMAQAISSFTGYQAHVHELSNQQDPFVQSYVLPPGVNPNYTFVVEVIKDLDTYTNQSLLLSEIGYVVGVVKPAHTLNYLAVSLLSSENYLTFYSARHNINFSDGDTLTGFDQQTGEADSQYGWKGNGYLGQFTINQSLIGGPILIGPRYTLGDNNEFEFQNTSTENHSLSTNFPIAFTLNLSQLNVNPFFYPDQVVQVVAPALALNAYFTPPLDERSESFSYGQDEEFGSGGLQPVFQFNLSQLNLTPLSIDAPAQESLTSQMDLGYAETNEMISNAALWFTLNLSPLNQGIFALGYLDKGVGFGTAVVEDYHAPSEHKEVGTGWYERMPAVAPELELQATWPLQEDNAQQFQNVTAYFMTNVTPLNLTPLIPRRAEIELPLNLGLHEVMLPPLARATYGTTLQEPKYGTGETLFTGLTWTNTTMSTGTNPRPIGLVNGTWLVDTATWGVGYNETHITHVDNTPALRLNVTPLNEGALSGESYELLSMSASQLDTEAWEPPGELAVFATALVEESYSDLTGTSFVVNQNPLNTAVLGLGQRVSNDLAAWGTNDQDSVPAYYATLDLTRDVLSNAAAWQEQETPYVAPVDRALTDVVLPFDEGRFGYADNLFITNSSLTGNTSTVLLADYLLSGSYALTTGLTDSVKLQYPYNFTLNVSALCSGAFASALRYDPATAVLSSGTTVLETWVV